MSADDVIAATFLLPSSSATPLVVELPHHALRLVVVGNESVGLLDDSWNTSGVYILLGDAEGAGHFSAYIGKAPSGLRGRVREHVRSRKGWNRALLVAHTSYGFSSAAVGWLEGALWDVLDRAPAAQLRNRQRPRDETLPSWDRRELERYLAPVTAVLRALGANPDTPDQQAPARRRSRSPRRYDETIADLIEAGLLKPGTRLRPLPQAHDTPAEVLADGRLAVEGEAFDTPSAAAMHITGRSANGWDFWAAPSGAGTMQPLAELRSRLRGKPKVAPTRQAEPAEEPAAPPAALQPPVTGRATRPRRERPSGEKPRSQPRRVEGSLGDLLAQDLLGDRRIHATYKGTRREGEVTADGTVRLDDGSTHVSLSQAAVHVTGRPTNGWTFWKAEQEGKAVTLASLRSQLGGSTGSGEHG